MLVEDETIERPIAELLRRSYAAPATAWLCRWMLMTGALAASLTLWAIVLTLLQGTNAVHWRGPFLSLCGVFIVFVVRHYMLTGTPRRTVCHRTFCTLGLAAGGVVLQQALVRSALRFIHGSPFADVLTECLVFCLVGVAGLVVSLQALRDRSWAGRVSAVGAVVVLALIALQPLVGYALLGGAPAFDVSFLHGSAAGLIASAVLAAGLTAWLDLVPMAPRGRRPAPRAVRVAGPISWCALLATVTGFVACRQYAVHGPGETADRFWQGAALLSAAALAPVVLAGMSAAWRTRSRFRDDVSDATDFAWTLIALGGMACLLAWTVTHLHDDALELVLGCAGILAAMGGAWLGATGGDWTGRWALLPLMALTVGVLCSLDWLLALIPVLEPGPAPLWIAGLLVNWAALVVGLALATAGLAVRRQRARAQQPRLALQADANLICTWGSVVPGLLLAVLFALAAGTPELRHLVREAIGRITGLMADALVLAGGPSAPGLAAQTLAPLRPMLSGGGPMALVAVVLLTVLIVHLLAASRTRWSFLPAAVVWLGVIAVGAAYALLYTLRLLAPIRQSAFATAAGRWAATVPAVRLMALTLLIALLARFGEAARSMMEMLHRAQARRGSVGSRSGDAGDWAALRLNRHLSFLVNCGTLAAMAGLWLALLLSVSPPIEAASTGLRALAGQVWQQVLLHTGQAGRLAGETPGFAFAAGAILFVLAALHEEVRTGRTVLYPVVSLIWLIALIPNAVALAVALRFPPETAVPYRTAILASVAVCLAVLLAATVVLMMQRWKGNREQAGDYLDAVGAGDTIGAARSLGTAGLLVCLAGGVLVLHWALGNAPAYAALFGRATAAARAISDATAGWVVRLRVKLETERSLGFARASLAGLSVAVLLLHVVAQRRIAWARSAVLAVWAAAMLAGAAAIGYALTNRPWGTWHAGHVFACALAAAAFLRTLVALANARSWLVRPT